MPNVVLVEPAWLPTGSTIVTIFVTMVVLVLAVALVDRRAGRPPRSGGRTKRRRERGEP